MKKIFTLLLFTTSLYSFNAFSQNGDLEIAQAIIGQKKIQIDTILSSFDIDYYITQDKESVLTLFVAKGNESVRLWRITFGNKYIWKNNKTTSAILSSSN